MLCLLRRDLLTLARIRQNPRRVTDGAVNEDTLADFPEDLPYYELCSTSRCPCGLMTLVSLLKVRFLKRQPRILVRRRRNYYGSDLGLVSRMSPACTLATERRKWGTPVMSMA